MSPIPLFYRIFFLYIDPLICLSGIYLFFFDHASYVQNGVPSILSSRISIIPNSDPITNLSLTPITHHLITALGSYSLFVLIMQILLLQQFRGDVRIWKTVQFGILVIDLGLLYGNWKAEAAYEKQGLEGRRLQIADWLNNGILAGVAVVRGAFLAGVGGVGVGDR
jgi:hypothetical protein